MVSLIILYYDIPYYIMISLIILYYIMRPVHHCFHTMLLLHSMQEGGRLTKQSKLGTRLQKIFIIIIIILWTRFIIIISIIIIVILCTTYYYYYYCYIVHYLLLLLLFPYSVLDILFLIHLMFILMVWY